MEDFNKFLDLDFKTFYYGTDLTESVNKLKVYIETLNQCFDNEQSNFAEICYCVSQIKKLFDDYTKSWYRGFETQKARYTFESLMKNFGLDDSQVSRIVKVYEKFVVLEKDKPKIKKVVSGFSKSKLIELLSVDNEQLELDIKNKVIRPDMTVKQIRDYVKNYHALQKQKENLFKDKEEKVEEEFDESEIPMVYDPTKYYEFSYFESKTKSQLLNMIWDLQKEYLKLKEKNKK